MGTDSKKIAKTLFDSFIYGGLNTQGSIKEVYDIEAIKNAILMWLGSFRGEYLNNPTSGGYLTQHLMKPMSDDRTELIQLSLLQGFKNDFYPSLIISNIYVEANKVKRFYYISVSGYSPTVDSTFVVGEKFRNFNV